MGTDAETFISPIIESAEVFSAIETAIPPDAIAQAVDKTDSVEERFPLAPRPVGSLSGDRHESVVSGLDANSPEEAGEWVEYAVDSAGAVLASAKQFINQRSQTASRMSGDESAISSGGTAPGYAADSLVRF